MTIKNEIIKNRKELATNRARKTVLDVLEKGLEEISPQKILGKKVKMNGTILRIGKKRYDLARYERVFLVGIGKGSAENAKIIEGHIAKFLTSGWVIDAQERLLFSKINYMKGTHPLPSQENRKFTETMISGLGKMTKRDLVLFVICGGGSAMLFLPDKVSTERYIQISKTLLTSGATIEEMNTVRKHLSRVKGGGMAKILYPATVAGIIFSDVPGDDISVIASGPLTKDEKTIKDALQIVKKYHLDVTDEELTETVKEDKYFKKVEHLIVLNNKTALEVMERAAGRRGISVVLHDSVVTGEAREVAKKLIDKTRKGEMVIAGGETTVSVKGHGKGGRNQELVLSALEHVSGDEVISSVNSDGWDNTEFAGAIGDRDTLKKAKNAGIDPKKYLEENDSYHFFQTVNDGIITGRLPSNVSDLIVVYKP